MSDTHLVARPRAATDLVITGALASIVLPFLAPFVWYRAEQELARVDQRKARTSADERRALETAQGIAIATTYALVILVFLLLSLVP